jgi:type II secretory pathway component PulK
MKKGFALLAVLWTIAILGTVVGLAMASTRLGHQTTLNRILLARGRWAAEACLAIAQARWAQGKLADTATIDLGRETRCAWRLDDPTAGINVNTAEREMLSAVSRQLSASDSFVAHLLERRRHAPLFDVSELASLPGYEQRLTPFITVDGPGTVNVSAAPGPVLAALPGLTPEAVERLLARRAQGRPISSLDGLVAELSGPAQAALLARYPDLARLITFTSPQLRLTGLGWVGSSGVGGSLRSTIELLVVPLPERLAVIRRRVW